MLKRIFNNLPVKIISLLAAALLWVIIIASQSRAGYFPGKIPILYTGLPVNLVYVTDVSSVQAKIITDPETWSHLTANNFSAKVDLSNLSEGTHTVPINVTSNNDKVQVVEKNPATVLVRIEHSKTKTLPVTVKTIGAVKPGYQISSTSVDPDHVNVTGPASLIDGLTEVTAPTLIDETSGEDQVIQSKVKVLNKQGEEVPNLTFSPALVSVNIGFSQNSLGKTVGIQVKTIGSLPSGYVLNNLDINPKTVSITGDSDTLNRISQVSTKPFSLSNLTSNTTRKVDLDLPDGISLSEGQANTFMVTAQIDKADISRTISIPVQVNNIASNLHLSNLSDSSVIITVNGSPDLINGLNPSDFKLNIDANNKGQGNYSVTLQDSLVSSPKTGYSISQFDPTKVSYSLVNN